MLRKKVLDLIVGNHGLLFSQLNEKLNEEERPELIHVLDALIIDGTITFIWNRYYPNVRSIGLIPKGQSETTEIIDLLIEIPLDELKKVIASKPDDPLLFDGYLITEHNKYLFERTNNFEFDFDNYQYYLLSSFDNSNDINGAIISDDKEIV